MVSYTNKLASKVSLFVFAFICFLCANTAIAQSEYKAENEGWLVNVEEAYAESKKTGKPILANFTGSDWCGWCKKLTRDVFVQDEFKSWADENVVLLELDFPRRTQIPVEVMKQNQGLQQAFKVRGYPTIWVFDLDRDDSGQYKIAALGKTGYSKSPREFTSSIDQMIARRDNSNGKSE